MSSTRTHGGTSTAPMVWAPVDGKQVHAPDVEALTSLVAGQHRHGELARLRFAWDSWRRAASRRTDEGWIVSFGETGAPWPYWFARRADTVSQRLYQAEYPDGGGCFVEEARLITYPNLVATAMLAWMRCEELPAELEAREVQRPARARTFVSVAAALEDIGPGWPTWAREQALAAVGHLKPKAILVSPSNPDVIRLDLDDHKYARISREEASGHLGLGGQRMRIRFKEPSPGCGANALD